MYGKGGFATRRPVTSISLGTSALNLTHQVIHLFELCFAIRYQKSRPIEGTHTRDARSITPCENELGIILAVFQKTREVTNAAYPGSQEQLPEDSSLPTVQRYAEITTPPKKRAVQRNFELPLHPS